MSEPVVDYETALGEFERVCAARRVSIDESKMSDFEKVIFARGKKLFVELVMDGSLKCGEGHEVTYYPQMSDAKPFVFGQVKGSTYLKADEHKGQVHQAQAMTAEVTGRPYAEFGKLHSYDYKNLKEITQIFLD